MPKAVLVDVTKCMGCRSCQVACKQWNELPAEKTRFTGATNPTEISAKTWTQLDFHAATNADDTPVWRLAKNQCMHCLDPACASVCPVGALHKTAAGPVTYDSDKCFGCRYCMVACPFGVPAFEWQKPLALMRKCSMCADRVEAGQEPACVATCPTDALVFGERDEMIARAEARIAQQPDRYINYIYGRDEVGGTSWLYIADITFDQLGLRTDLPREGLSRYTWQAMTKVPWIMVGGSVLMTGLYLYSQRRTRLEAERKEG